MHIRMAVISDLHVGSGTKAKDFSLPGSDIASVDNYLDKFKDFVNKEDIRADYLLVPGDITHRAGKDEFSLAAKNIELIAEALGVDRGKIVFCPGNHDVHWDTAEQMASLGHTEPYLTKSKFLNLTSEPRLFGNNMGLGQGRFDEYPFFVTWEFDNVVFFSLNTAVFDGRDRRPHCGEVKPDQLAAIDAELSSISTGSKLKVCLFHHHPIQYLERTFTEPDFSIMVNAVGLLDLLSKHQVDFIVHGHKHIPRFKMEINTSGHPLSILCAGSFSAYLDNKYFESVGNRFHVIQFDERCPLSNFARGTVNTWTFFLGSGWTRSTRGPDAERQHNFGAFLPRPQLIERLSVALSEILGVTDYATWESFLDAYPEFKYHTNESLRAALKLVGQQSDLVMHEIESLNLDQLVILKGQPK